MQTLLNYRPGIAMMQRIDQYNIEAIVFIFFSLQTHRRRPT